MASLASDDPNDPSNLLAQFIDATPLRDGSYLLRVWVERDMPHLDGYLRSVRLTVAHKLGVGRWLEEVGIQPDGPSGQVWSARYLPEPVDTPADVSALDESGDDGLADR